MSYRRFLTLIVAGALVAGCSSDPPAVTPDSTTTPKDATVNSDADGKVAPDTAVADKGPQPLRQCNNPGGPCTLPDPCAINPICGKDYICRASSMMNCDDNLPCTKDTCVTLGVCKNEPKPGFCLLPVPAAYAPDMGVPDGGSGDAGSSDAKVSDAGSSAKDAGASGTVLRCFKKGDRHPKDSCKVCEPGTVATDAGTTDAAVVVDAGFWTPDRSVADASTSGNPRAWTPTSGGSCNDGNACTKNDTCIAGVCQGSFYGSICNTSDPCMEVKCDGNGGCLPPAIKKGYCKIGNQCYADKTPNPSGACQVCDVTNSQSSWSPVQNACTIDGICYGNGAKNPAGCGECDTTKSTTSWTIKGTTCCIINNTVYTAGTKDSTGCSSCDPTKSTTAWTPLSTVCVISNQCLQKGAKNPAGCGECDPAKSTTSWTVSGNTCCLINGTSVTTGTKTSGGCEVCDPSTDPYKWSPFPGTCKIDGTCYRQGDQFVGGCAMCDATQSTTAWTVTGANCLINKTCKKSGDLDTNGCSSCDPTKSKTSWTPVSGKCLIDGVCYASGTKHSGGCAQCDPTKNAKDWTVTGTGCFINETCYASGTKDVTGCGTCAPATSKTTWTPSSGFCVFDGTCYAKGVTLPGGCAKCDPAKSATSWTIIGTGCMIDQTCYASGAKHTAGCGSCDPSKSATSWTVTGSGCLIGHECYVSGAVEPGGCGKCVPTTSNTAWSRPTTSCLQTSIWSRRFGSSSSDQLNDLVVDMAGNIYITGSFYSTVDFGGGNETASGSNADAFVASYSQNGNFRWVRTFGGTSSDVGQALALDGAGNVYVTGYFQGSANFGGGTVTASGGSNDIFLASYTNTGAHRWSKAFGSSSSEVSQGIAADKSGNVTIVGYFSTGFSFGGSTLSNSGSNDIFVANFDKTGTHKWSKAFGSSSSDIAYSAAADSKGNIWVTGYFNSSVNFGGSSLSSQGSHDIYLVKFTPAGAHSYSKAFGSYNGDVGQKVVVDASDNVYLTGYYYSAVNFGGSTLNSRGSNDMYLAVFNSSGTHQWSKSLGGPSNDYGYGIAVDSLGNVYVTGYYNDTVDFGDGYPITTEGSYDLYVIAYDKTGKYRWHRVQGGSSADYGRAIGVDGLKGVTVGGTFQNTVDFGGGAFASKGGQDIIVFRIKQ